VTPLERQLVGALEASASGPRTDPMTASSFDLSSVDLYINSQCNRRCAFCFLPDEYLASRVELSVGVASSIIEWCVGTVEEITLLGGEPSLHPRMPEIAEMVASAHLKLRIVTNASPPFRQLLELRSFVRALDSSTTSRRQASTRYAVVWPTRTPWRRLLV
jgi:organic radical activating enzyme